MKLQSAICLAIVCLAGLFAAEQPTRSVQGIVLDTDGQPLRGAVVQLKDMRTLAVRSYVANDDGAYQFVGLRMDVEYRLQATWKDMSSKVKTLSIFDERRVALLNLRLEPGTEPVSPPREISPAAIR